ncbi:MAG: substrate-binding domain-containing protein [Lachnospiraceae bacterium]
MEKRVTIKDIASKAGVSLGTVHLALSDKAGVSEATRRRIRAIAKELNYHPNVVAASLKRKTIRIAACFPEMEGDNRFYYPQMWNGFRASQERMVDFNIEFQEYAYPENFKEECNRKEKMECLNSLREKLEAGEIDGLVMHGNRCPFTVEELRFYGERGLTISLVDTDLPESGRLCCVAADYDSLGRTLAEQVVGRIPSCGSIFICAGREEYPSHRLIVEGFEAYMRENGHENLIYKEHSNQVSDEAYENILSYIKRPDIAAACCVSSRSSLMLGRAIEASGKAGKIMAVGSDLFDENKDFLRRGVFQNLVQKNPFGQAFMATKFLMDYLIKDVRPEPLFVVGSQMVFRSNLVLYEKNSVRFLE